MASHLSHSTIIWEDYGFSSSAEQTKAHKGETLFRVTKPNPNLDLLTSEFSVFISY